MLLSDGWFFYLISRNIAELLQDIKPETIICDLARSTGLSTRCNKASAFLHDVQRAQYGNSIFGVNSTFKTNHFLGYTVALNRLDGVYYVDPRPVMLEDARLRGEIQDFQTFLVRDLWTLARSR